MRLLAGITLGAAQTSACCYVMRKVILAKPSTRSFLRVVKTQALPAHLVLAHLLAGALRLVPNPVTLAAQDSFLGKLAMKGHGG